MRTTLGIITSSRLTMLIDMKKAKSQHQNRRWKTMIPSLPMLVRHRLLVRSTSWLQSSGTFSTMTVLQCCDPREAWESRRWLEHQPGPGLYGSRPGPSCKPLGPDNASPSPTGTGHGRIVRNRWLVATWTTFRCPIWADRIIQLIPCVLILPQLLHPVSGNR